jgi:capsular exopolysaccharide synthesis family protein
METVLNEISSGKFEPESNGVWTKKFSAPKTGIAVWDILKRRRRVFIPVTLVIFLLAAAVILTLPTKFVATAKIKLDPTRDAMAVGEQKLRPDAPDQILVDTEVSIIKSREVGREVVLRLNLDRNPTYAGPDLLPGRTTLPETLRLDEIVDRVLQSLEVEREKGTYLVEVSYTAKKREDAARIANAFASSYIAKSLSSRTGTATQQAEFLKESVEAMRKRLQQSDAEYARYASQAGVVAQPGGGGLSGTVTDQEIAPLTAQVAQAESDAAAAASKLNSARAQVATGGLDAVANVLDSPVVTSLRQQRAEIAKELGDSASRFGPNHPDTIMARERAQRVDQQIDSEARRIIASLASDAASSSARAASLQGQLSTLRGRQAANTRASVVATSLQLRSDSDRDAYNKEREQFQQIRQVANNTMTQATIVEPASPKVGSMSPNKPFYLAIAFIAASIVGAGVISAQELFSSGLRLPSEIETELGIPFIVSVPKIKWKPVNLASSPADVVIDTPVSPFAEAFRIARSTLLTGAKGLTPRIISMMSTLPDEGKTTCSLALARVMAMSGEKVLLIDCDLRQTGMTRAVGGEGRVGLVEILLENVDFERAIYPDRAPRLDTICISSPLFTAEDMFGPNTKMAPLLRSLLERYDRIILDTPPVLGVADAKTLADLSDASVLLVKWNNTPLASVHAALARFEGDHSHVRGAIFTMVDEDSEAIGATYYSKKYSRYYQQA